MPAIKKRGKRKEKDSTYSLAKVFKFQSRNIYVSRSIVELG
jgi:hypothetical protein